MPSRSVNSASTIREKIPFRLALIGLAAGTLFGLAAIGFQTAARSVVSDSFVVQAATTLLIGITFQTVLTLIYMIWKDRDEISRIRVAWKPALLVGPERAVETLSVIIGRLMLDYLSGGTLGRS